MAKVSKDYIDGCEDMLNKVRYLLEATEIKTQEQPLNIKNPQIKLLKDLKNCINTVYISIEKLKYQNKN